MTAKLEHADQEYQIRFKWFRFLPPGEREEFAEAEAAHDLKTITKLQKRGRRRDKFCVFELCSQRLIIGGDVFLGGPPGRESCTCAVDALDSDALYRHLTNLELPEGSFRSSLDGKAMDGFREASEWLHDHQDRPLREWIAADKVKRKRSALVREHRQAIAQAAETVPAEPPATYVAPATPEPEQPPEPTREEKQLAQFRRTGRVKRWYDPDEGLGAFWDKVF